MTIYNTSNPYANHRPQQQDDADIAVANARPKMKKPPLYQVVLLNDDFTPMDFVVDVLQHYFALDAEQATEIMLMIHYQGKGIAGVYPKDIAETKAHQVVQHARAEGHPLLCLAEPQP
ncbi:MAG: ATP-dependent Clp protease adapter ClpS [Acinetobacter sp.]|nr:ATP-dependent Clp protease adapter ClpS [Acinetobacter sp.]